MYGTEQFADADFLSDRRRHRRGENRQARPLDAMYPIIYLDCIHVKVREGHVRVKAGIWPSASIWPARRKSSASWIAQTEGAKFWLQVVTELEPRRWDILIACVDGLKGSPSD